MLAVLMADPPGARASQARMRLPICGEALLLHPNQAWPRDQARRTLPCRRCTLVRRRTAAGKVAHGVLGRTGV